MKTSLTTRNLIIFTALGATTATLTALGRYVRSEIISRGYPSWRSVNAHLKPARPSFLFCIAAISSAAKRSSLRNGGSL